MNIEKTTAYVSYGIALTSAAIYCYCLGYLDYFKVIDYPSWFNSHVFFFSTALNKSVHIFNTKTSIDTGLDKSILLSSVGTIVGLASVLVTEFFRLKEKMPENLSVALQKISNFKAIFGSVIISMLFVLIVVLFFRDTFIFMLPVLLAPMASLFVGMTIVEKLEKTGGKASVFFNTKVDDLAVFAITLSIVWLMPYKMGNITASKIDPLKSFPSAWSGSETYSSNDLLVWKEDEKGFWLNCKEKVIYGVTNDGHIFFSRSTSVLDNVECK